MLKSLLRRPSPATVMSAIALFVSLGGVGYAAAHIGSAQIKNNSIRGKDIHNSTITGKDVKNGSLGGADVKESKLGEVPAAAHAESADNAKSADTAASATTAATANLATRASVATSAGNATTANGQRIVKFSGTVADDDPELTLANLGGLRVIGTCPGGDTELRAQNTSGATGTLQSGGGKDNTVAFSNADEEFTTSDTNDIVSGGSGAGTSEALFPSGSVTVLFGFNSSGPASSPDECQYYGRVIYG